MAAQCQENTKTITAGRPKKAKKPPVATVNKNVKNLYREHSKSLNRYRKKAKDRSLASVQEITIYIQQLSERDFSIDTDIVLSQLAQELRHEIRRLEELVYETPPGNPPLLLYQQEYVCEAVYFLRSLKNIVIDEMNDRARRKAKRPAGTDSKKGETRV